MVGKIVDDLVKPVGGYAAREIRYDRIDYGLPTPQVIDNFLPLLQRTVLTEADIRALNSLTGLPGEGEFEHHGVTYLDAKYRNR